MSKGLSLCLLVALCAAPTLARADYRGSYELLLTAPEGEFTVSGDATVSDGEAITHTVGDRLVWMQSHFTDDETYYLIVSALPLRGSGQDVGTYQAHTFTGQQGSPTSFEAAVGGGVTVTGTMVVQRLAE